jgi:hypothetical protein
VWQLEGKIMLANDDNFEGFMAMSNERLVIIDFCSSYERGWRRDSCLSKLAEEYHGKVIIALYPGETFRGKYPREFAIGPIPTLLFVKNKQIKQRMFGYYKEDFGQRIVNIIEQLLNGDSKDSESFEVPAGYMDLGLPSGTLWKDKNESGFYDCDAAVRAFGSSLPTKEQWEELKTKCDWEWDSSEKGYYVKGTNGESIFLPASGGRNCDGDVYGVGASGRYWSSAPNGSKYAWSLYFESYAWSPYFESPEVRMEYDRRCYGRSVRLVQSK